MRVVLVAIALCSLLYGQNVFAEEGLKLDPNLSSYGIEVHKRDYSTPSSVPDYVVKVDLSKTEFHVVFGPILENICALDVGCQSSFGGKSPHYKSKSIKEGEFKMPLEILPTVISSGAFGGRWIPNYTSGEITFPIRVNGKLETEGYADPSGYNLENLSNSDIKVLCINNNTGKASIYDDYDLRTSQNDCNYEIMSFNKDYPKRDSGGKTFVGVTQDHKLLIFSSKGATRKEAYEALTKNFNAINTIQFDGGGSSQLLIKDQGLPLKSI
jgi:hypothetical protein